jgi:hypothetical protein
MGTLRLIGASGAARAELEKAIARLRKWIAKAPDSTTDPLLQELKILLNEVEADVLKGRSK